MDKPGEARLAPGRPGRLRITPALREGSDQKCPGGGRTDAFYNNPASVGRAKRG